MTTGDLLVERGARRLQHLAGRAAQRGDGIGEWLSDELTNDAAFLRRLKPRRAPRNAGGGEEARRRWSWSGSPSRQGFSLRR